MLTTAVEGDHQATILYRPHCLVGERLGDLATIQSDRLKHIFRIAEKQQSDASLLSRLVALMPTCAQDDGGESSILAPLRLWMQGFRFTLRGERRELSEENDRTDDCKGRSAGQTYGQEIGITQFAMRYCEDAVRMVASPSRKSGTNALYRPMRERLRKRATGLKVSLPATRWQKIRAISREGA